MLKKSVIFFIYLLISVAVFTNAAYSPGIDGYERSMLDEMVHGEAHKPFVYRALIPATINVLEKISPESFEDLLENALSGILPLNYIFGRFGWHRENFYLYFLAFIVMVSLLTAFPYALKSFMDKIFKPGPVFRELVPVLSLASLPVLFAYYVYLYDFAMLLMSALLFSALSSRNWKLYLPLFAIAVLNKETAVLFAVFSFAYFYVHDNDKTKHIKLFAVQAAIFIIIKTALYFIYADNPGSVMEYYFRENLLELLHVISFEGFAALIVLFVIFFHSWDKKPDFLRYSFIIGGMIFVLTVFFGQFSEVRVYYEFYPAASLLAADSLSRIAGYQQQVNPV